MTTADIAVILGGVALIAFLLWSGAGRGLFPWRAALRPQSLVIGW